MSRTITVTHTVNSLRADHGGPSRSVPALVRAQQAVGLDARLHVRDCDGRLPQHLRTDIVHDHGVWLPTNHDAARTARRLGVPFVSTPRGMLEPWALGRGRWKKRLAWLLYQRSDLAGAAVIHVTSDAEAQSVRAVGLRVPTVVVPNGVQVPETLPAWENPPVQRALFLSRIHAKKGLPMLVEAWSRVRPPGWELVIAGPDEGGHRAEVERLTDAAGISNAIRFAGAVPDDAKWQTYRSADLFVLPTHSENFGLVVAEALGAGLPALTTRGAPWQILDEVDAGWWVDPEVGAIEEALRQATAMPRDRLRAMGARGHLYVREHLSWDAAAAALAATYDGLLAPDANDRARLAKGQHLAQTHQPDPS